MPPKKVAKRKPRKSVPLVNQNQRNRQETKVTVNLAGLKDKPRRRRKAGVARVAQPTSNIVNVSPSFAPAFQPSFAPQPSFYSAPAIGSSAGFGLSPPPPDSLGVPITLGDGELGVPTFGGDARESIGRRNDLITQPATVSGNYDPYSQQTTVRPRMPDIIVQRPTQPVSEISVPIGSVSFTEPESSQAIITQPPSVAPTFASTVAGAFSNFKNSPTVSQFINAPPKKAKKPVTPPSSVVSTPPPSAGSSITASSPESIVFRSFPYVPPPLNFSTGRDANRPIGFFPDGIFSLADSNATADSNVSVDTGRPRPSTPISSNPATVIGRSAFGDASVPPTVKTFPTVTPQTDINSLFADFTSFSQPTPFNVDDLFSISSRSGASDNGSMNIQGIYSPPSVFSGSDNPLFINRQRDTQDGFSIDSQRSFATPILSDKSQSAKSGRFKLADENVDGGFNMGDLYSVGETEFLFSNELDPPLTPFSGSILPESRAVVNIIAGGGRGRAKRGGESSDSDSEKSARGFNIVPSEERATAGRRMTPINEKKAVPSRYEKMSLGQLQGIAKNLGVDTSKAGARGQPKNRTRAELIAGITAL